MSSSQSTNPRIPIQDVWLPWHRSPKLCEQCRRMFEIGSFIDLEGTSAYNHPEFCGCEVHRPAGLCNKSDRRWIHENPDYPLTEEFSVVLGSDELWRVHHPSPQGLLQAVLDSCEFCTELLRGRDVARLEDAFTTCYLISKGGPVFADDTSRYTIQISGTHHENGSFDFFCWPREYEQGRIGDCSLPVQSLGTSSTGSLECAELARWWLKDCIETHRLCSSNVSKPWYPTRLLKITKDYVHLIDTYVDDETLRGPYATLSYCWGTEKFDVLTAETIARFKAGLEVEQFLPTFKHAFEIVNRLGIEYLWIDCFCIVQDTLDWEVESAKMLEVYSNSILNIGAEHACDPRQGLYAFRTPSVLKMRCVRWQPEDDTPQKLFMLTSERKPNAIYPSDNGPLWRRAWVVQERMLSPRLLYFGEQQISWTCPTVGTLTEVVPTAASAAYFSLFDKHNKWKCAVRTALRDDKTINSKTTACQIWHKTLYIYSQANLSYATDKLRAIQGVAELLAPYRNDVYLEGSFIKSLLKEACFSLGFEGPERVHYEDRAPTYSWVAWDGDTSVPSMEPGPGEMLATYVPDLRLATRLPSPLYCIGRLLPVQCYNDGYSLMALLKGSRMESFHPYDDLNKSPLHSPTLFFPVYLSPPGFPSNANAVRGILVEPSSNSGFRRVGQASFRFHDGQRDLEDEWKVNAQNFLDVCARARPQLIPLV